MGNSGDNCRLDDEAWFGKIWMETYPRLYKLGRGLIYYYSPGLLDELTDILQKTYLEMYEKRDEVRRKGNAPQWLTRALRYNITNRAAVRRSRLKYHSEAEVFEETGSEREISAEEAFLEAEEDAIQVMKKTLGQEDYENLVSYAYKEINLDELAQKYGKTKGAMKTHVSRWKSRCLDALKKEGLLFVLIISSHVTFDLFTMIER